MTHVDGQKVEVRGQSKVAVAANNVNVDTQNNRFDGPRQNIELTRNEDSRQWAQSTGNTIHSNPTTTHQLSLNFFNSPLRVLPPLDNAPAAYFLNRSGRIQPGDPYVWNPELGRLSSADAYARQQLQT
jgi:hypothetical protein